MYNFVIERTHKIKNIHVILLCVFLLLGIGLVTLYSASYTFSFNFFNDGNSLIKRQLVFAAVGFTLFFIFSYLSLDVLRKFVLILVCIAVVLCLLTFIPGIRVEKGGATRWIEIGFFSYQPSEMVKFVLPLYLAHSLDKKSDKLDGFVTGFLSPVIVTGLFFVLIYMQNNFSTAVFVVFNALVIFILAGMKWRYFFSAVAMVIPISAILIFTKPHRVMRLLSFINPDLEPLKAGFQMKASREAIASSGFLGKGIGEGTRKIASVPTIHSDFIMCSYVEETGFLGLLILFAMFGMFAYFGFKTAWNSKTVFGRLLAAGATTMIVSQALLNIAVVCGALPATGIPLPFFSAGGSSLITTFICAGFVFNVARKDGVNTISEKNNLNYMEDDSE
ncbi:MAG: putative lipid II flippase FtsW [Treponema sp.]|nr:putative lipid II flippase FtsW [Treponema sp.]